MGESAAIAAALIWAIASVVYARLGQTIDPMGLNFAKGVIAIAFLICTPTLWFQHGSDLPLQSLGLLALSGILGVGLGDTFFLEMLKALGPRKTLLLDSLAPTLTAALAWIILKETLPLLACLGIVLTLGGIFWVIQERTTPDQPPAHIQRGILLGLGAGLANAGGAILSRAALEDSMIRPEVAALTRIVAGVLLLMLWGLSRGIFISWCRNIIRHPQFKYLVGAAFGSAYLGIWLQQIGFKYAPAGITQTLLATSPLFILPIAILTGEKVSFKAWVGAIIAFFGIALLALSRQA
jgi:drug/metabolite transporter (DMT)-like permease